MITWADKVAFVGMVVEIMPVDEIDYVGFYYEYRVRVRTPGGACSYGDGNTMEEAIESAATGMRIGWSSVERKITEAEWAKMSHT